MPFPLFRAVVDEAVSLGVRDLVLNGYGEIATLRNSAEYIGYIRRRSASIRILVNTNGMRLTRELAAAFIEHGVDIVNVTIDGATAETYEAIRKHLKLDVVEENVRRLIAMRNALGRKRPYIMTHMICMPENEHEIDAFIKKWTGVSDHVGGAGLYSRGGSVKGRPQTPDWSLPCFLLWRQMPILSDGSVAMCCDDWDGAMSPGNVADGGIRAIWTSPRMQELRRIQLEGRAVTNPLFPLLPGSVYVYADSVSGETDTMTVTRDTPEFLGVRATVVIDRTYRRGMLIEDTRDFYAQDKAGNVWYLGEDTRTLKAGRVVSTEGSWQAGRAGGLPGIVMWAAPRVGEPYRQEYLKGSAEDMARVVALDVIATVPAGRYTDCVATEEWSPLEPGTRERKVYARGVGLVEQRSIAGGHEHLVLVTFTRVAYED